MFFINPADFGQISTEAGGLNFGRAGDPVDHCVFRILGDRGVCHILGDRGVPQQTPRSPSIFTFSLWVLVRPNVPLKARKPMSH